MKVRPSLLLVFNRTSAETLAEALSGLGATVGGAVLKMEAIFIKSYVIFVDPVPLTYPLLVIPFRRPPTADPPR